MNRMKFSVILAMITLYLASITTFSIAGEFPIDKVRSDLSTQTARLIQGPEEHVLLNQGRKQGIQKGDLWSLYLPAQPVKDTETGESLGKFAPRAAVARVVQVQKRFSEIEVQCIKEKGCQLSSGMKAVRFDQVKAWFIDKGGPFSETYRQLNAQLNHLDWQGCHKAAKKLPSSGSVSSAWGVVFVSSQDGLTVWSGGQVKEMYSAQEKGSASATSGAVSDVQGTSGPLKVSDFDLVISLDRKVDHMGLARSSDSQDPYLILLSNRQIRAKNLEKERMFEYEYQGFGQVIDLSVAGNNLLAVNIYDPDTGMRSMLLEITDSGFKKKAKGIKYMLSFMGPAGDDKEPVLWGQRFSPTDLLHPVVFRLKIQDDAVNRGKRVEVPSGFSLIGAFLGDVNNNGKAEMGFFHPGGQMVVQEQGAQVWESTEKFAPSHGSFLVSDPQNFDMAPSKVPIWGKPAMFSAKDQSYAAIPANEAGLSSMLNSQPKQGTVALFFGQDSLYRLQRLVDQFQGPILDLAVFKDRLLICVEQNERSRVISVPWAQLVAESFQ